MAMVLNDEAGDQVDRVLSHYAFERLEDELSPLTL